MSLFSRLFKTKRRNVRKEQCILTISSNTGWDHKTSEAALDKAYEVYGIVNRDYVKYELYKYSFEEANEKYLQLKQKEADDQLKRQQKKRLKYISAVAKETGWTEDYAREQMAECQARTGMSFEHYSAYRFWELPVEEQDTYFTKGHADHLMEKYNTDEDTLRVMVNKDVFCSYFKEYLGRKCLSSLFMDYSAFKDSFSDVGKVIYKPRAATGGKGIKVFSFDENNIQEVYKQIKQEPDGVVEGFLEQHPEMSRLSVNSVNTVRVVTIRTNNPEHGIEVDKVHVLYAGLRMGAGDKYVDNMHSGGLIAGLDYETGKVTTPAINFKYQIFDKHPDTGTTIPGFQVPMMEEVHALIQELASKKYGYFGWDIAITPDGPIVIEGNTHPESAILQTPYVPLRKGMKHVIERYL